jgi:hypothetical protein
MRYNSTPEGYTDMCHMQKNIAMNKQICIYLGGGCCESVATESSNPPGIVQPLLLFGKGCAFTLQLVAICRTRLTEVRHANAKLTVVI